MNKMDSPWPPAVTAGLGALDKASYAEARAAFERAIVDGHTGDFLVNFGWLLEQGLGGEKDVPRAMALYRQALVAAPKAMMPPSILAWRS